MYNSFKNTLSSSFSTHLSSSSSSVPSQFVVIHDLKELQLCQLPLAGAGSSSWLSECRQAGDYCRDLLASDFGVRQHSSSRTTSFVASCCCG
ncbi:hypothetical protein RchiOBHm_Chr5g0065771 [Rosa chinensis]|uniref:Uncharacterized protein n=1 Tax=Rosa chinensis TaxID=74649 RepID=A0A2P6QJ03_ROSCH|nr:hypothetical protein RchiOBHm_Chr5g0065771 [Rosa chinensis]